MARGVKLDRRKRYEVAHDAGVPVVSTKGNIYIDDTSGNIWLRASGGSWQTASGFWDRSAGGDLSPSSSGDGLTIAATGNNNISLSTSASTGDISFDTTGSGNGDIIFDTSGSGSGDISFTTSGASSSFIVSLTGTTASASFVTNGTVGDFTVDTTSATNGDISFEAGGDIIIRSNTNDIRIGSSGSSSYLNINEATPAITLRSVDLSLEGVSTSGTSSVFVGFSGVASLQLLNSDDSATLLSAGNLETGSTAGTATLSGYTSTTVACSNGDINIQSVIGEVYFTAHSSTIAFNSGADSAPTTTDQTVIGAINEIDARFSGGFTGTVGSPSSITVANGIVTAVS